MADGASLDWKRMHVVIGGHRITGRAKGTAVQVTLGAQRNTAAVGIDGTGYFIMSEDRSGSVTVLLTPESESNDVLSEMLLVDEVTPGGVKQSLVVEDANGRTVIASPSAKIAKLPDAAWSDAADTRAWTFVFTQAFGRVGGMPTTATPS